MSFDEKGRICFNPNETLVLHIRSWKISRERIKPRNRPGFVFMNVVRLDIDEIDGAPGDFRYLVSSEKLAKAIMPLLESGAHAQRNVVLTARGEGFRRSYEFHSLPYDSRVSPSPAPAT